MASGTILIVLVPGIETIGLFAPALVLIGRLLQGFSAVRNWVVSSVYLSEYRYARPQRLFHQLGNAASQQVAIIVAAALGYGLNQWLARRRWPAWGWCIRCFVGCMTVPFIFFLRRNLEETEEFAARNIARAWAKCFARSAQTPGVIVLWPG